MPDTKLINRRYSRTASYHTIPYHAIPYHAIPYHTIPYHTIPYHAMPCHAIPYHTIPYHKIPYHTIPCHTIPYHTTLTLSLQLPKPFYSARTRYGPRTQRSRRRRRARDIRSPPNWSCGLWTTSADGWIRCSWESTSKLSGRGR